MEQFLKAHVGQIPHRLYQPGGDFFGQNLRRYNSKRLVKPTKKNTNALLEKIRGIINANKSVSQTPLFGRLNPIIPCWAN